jgi:hypothetical protein
MPIMSAVQKLNDKLTWCGLAPGLSTLENVLEKLGPPDEIENLTNGKIYHFGKGKIQATVLADSPQVEKILISRQMLTAPKTLADFVNLFGPIPEKLADQLQGVIYERDGVKIATDFEGNAPEIRWIELF